ncbi:MAG: ATP-binding protein [Pirellulaceae bacterium]
MDNSPSVETTDNLRERAERAVRKPMTDIEQMSLKDTQMLVHELQVHQIELEMQNEELRNAQLELQESRDKYSELYEFAPVGYLSLDRDGIIQEANLTASKMLSVQRSILIGSRFSKHVAAEEQDQLHLTFQKLYRSKESQPLELRILKENQPVWTQLEAKLHKAKPDKVFVTLNDISRRKHSEEMLLKQELELALIDRMNCMGQMVGGISHEVAQPLSAISSFASACESALKQSGRDQTDMLVEMNRNIAEQAIHAGEILKRLRSFIEPTQNHRSRFAINEVVADALKLTATQTSYFKVKVNTAFAAGLPDLVGDRVQIQQVVVNLLVNAFECMLDKPPEDRFVSICTSMSEAGVEVSVEDNGEGLTPEFATKVFETFFTTKATGMGLGLSICRTIIESHGGKLWVAPKSSRGAKFQFNLPF